MTVNEKKRPNYVIRILLCGGVLFLMLACVRFYAGHLEQEVAVVTRAIEQLSMEEMSLKQQLSALKSPNRVYSYCKDTLKMQKSTNVSILKKQTSE